MTQYQTQPAETPVLAFTALLSDQEVADILIMTVEWVRSHASEIPGLERLGMYYRFHRKPIEQWLGSLDRLLDADQVAAFMKVPPVGCTPTPTRSRVSCVLAATFASVPRSLGSSSMGLRLANDRLCPHNEATAEASRKG